MRVTYIYLHIQILAECTEYRLPGVLSPSLLHVETWESHSKLARTETITTNLLLPLTWIGYYYFLVHQHKACGH